MFNLTDPFIEFGFLTIIDGKASDPSTQLLVLELGRQVIDKPSRAVGGGL